MPSVQVRPFRRTDRDQVTDLVNAHIAAVVPNMSVSVQTLLSQLEREPGEYIVDPWVTERVTMVAERRNRVAAAAHLLRYGADRHVGESFRDAGEIRWLLHWPGLADAADALATACLAQLRRWDVSQCFADGTLPAPGVYGVPEQWPHVRQTYERIGFTQSSRTEEIYLARVDQLPRPTTAPVPGLSAARTVGVNGTRIAAVLDGAALGYLEVDTNLDNAARTSRTGIWADLGNLHIDQAHRRRGVATWLLGHAADWLALGGITRLLGYTGPDDDGEAAFLRHNGFRLLTRTDRALTRHRPGAGCGWQAPPASCPRSRPSAPHW